MPKLNIIETLCKDNLPHGRLPTIEECVAWVECSDNYHELNDYMLTRPEYTRHIRKIMNSNYHK